MREFSPRRLAALAIIALVLTGQATGGLPAAAAGQSAPSDLTIFAGGDIQLDGEPGRMALKNGAGYTFDLIKPLLDQADLRLANLECNISDLGSPLAEKPYTFRTDPAVLPALQGNFDALAFANNHSLDYGPEAFLDTIARTARAGLPLVGAGADRAAAVKPVIIETNGLRVAVLAYTTLFAVPVRWGPLWVPTADKPGVALADANMALPAVTAAKQDADVVVVVTHWGIEYEGVVAEQSWFAHALIDAGADIVIGSHPHVAQTFEVYNGRLIAYSLGNFVMEPGRPAADNFLGLTAKLASDGSVVSATVTPLHYDAGRPRPATADEAKAMLDQILPGVRGAAVTQVGSSALLRPQ